MIERFLIVGFGEKRPDAERIAFCDGAGGGMFREGADIELSHWRPNRTPARYRANTSTEMCLKFAADPLPGRWTLAVNNHLDVDGILSVYSLVHSEFAMIHQETIIQAAEMGDFRGWGEPAAQRVFQGVTWLMNEAKEKGGDQQAVYEAAFAAIPRLVDGFHSEAGSELIARIERSLEPLRQACAWVESGAIRRRPLGDRLTQYVVPREVARDDVLRATGIAGFNEAISERLLFWPHVRARWDRERVCLVSVEASGGWYHDVYAPGYLWADTETLWTIPGLRFADGMESYALDHPGLEQAVAELNRKETGAGRWILGTSPAPLGELMQEKFPVIVRFGDPEGEPAVSGLDAEEVGRALNDVFE